MTGKPQNLQVKLKGGSPWGFRLQGGVGTGLPLVVSKVRRKSKAYNNLREGDFILSVNDVPCSNLTYEQVMAIAEKSGVEISVQVERKGSRTENAAPEIKASISPMPIISHQKTTMTAMKTSENKTTVTDNTKNEKPKEDTTKMDNQTILLNTAETAKAKEKSFEKFTTDESTTSIENKFTPTENKTENPEVISDISVKISSEKTPSSEKTERLETEKFHEKSENKETLFTKTDFEECIKSNTPSTEPGSICESSELLSKTESKSETISTKNITSESHEILKSEKTEITSTKTTTNETVASVESKGEKSDLPSTNKISSMMENLPSLDTDIISSLNFNEFLSSSDPNSETVSITKKKKMFSSSSFYEEPLAIYPTVEEQFEMAKKIAESLADDTNKKSKGANMFFKRAMRSPKWVHEGPDPSNENFPDVPEVSPESYSPGVDKDKRFPSLKLVLDPRHAVDLASLRSTGHNISEHNVVSPDVCHELIRDLQSPAGKGGALFAKRKKKSSEWVVDEEKVRSMMRTQEQELNQLKLNINKRVTPTPGQYGTPWDSYLTSPGVINGGISKRVNPDTLAETVIKAADNKRRDSIQSLQEEPLFETCRSPIIPATPAASYYGIYQARVPKGWAGTAAKSTPEMDISYSNHTLQHSTYKENDVVPTHAATFPRKYHFQNFNTVPRKWKTQY